MFDIILHTHTHKVSFYKLLYMYTSCGYAHGYTISCAFEALAVYKLTARMAIYTVQHT